MKKVDFFIVGAPKCGTTAMYSYLKSHPEVFFPERKEPHYFGSDLDFHNQPRISLKDYIGLFVDAKPNQKLGDASVFYLMSTTAAEQIKAYNPSAKIIIMLRNPVDVMHSFHSQRLFNGTENIDSFPEAVAAESDRREGKRMPARIGLRQGLFYHDLVNFADQVKRYFDVFGREAIHVVFYEDLSTDLLGSYQKLCAFLEIDTSFQPVFETVNSNKVIRFGWLRDMLKHKPPALSAVGRILLPTAALRKSFRNAAMQLNMVTQPRAPVAQEIRSQLATELTPSIEKLEQLLGRDLERWRSRPVPGPEEGAATTAAG